MAQPPGGPKPPPPPGNPWMLREALYGSGCAAEALEERVDTLLSEAADLVDEDTVREEAAAIADQFDAD